MNRADMQQLATMRIAEAQALLAAGFPAGAYYLAGYAVECAIKSCIAKRVQQYDFPDKNTVEQSYKHDLEKLMKTAELDRGLLADMTQNKALAVNWALVIKWTEAKRYETSITVAEATDLITALSSPTDGVLSWIVQRW